MSGPPYGICLPAKFLSTRDGDTPVIAIEVEWAIRLKGINCPEKNEPGGAEATEFTRSLLENAESLRVKTSGHRSKNLMKGGSFDRVIADLWVDKSRYQDGVVATGWLTDLLVNAGHATRA
jgi:endonuclease YncB( thermonuclease family)